MKDLRKRTYEILGLPLGSLINEGGRDWNEAYREAQSELKVFIKEERCVKSYKDDNLTESEILNYMQTNDKDIILHFLRSRKNLTKEMIKTAVKNNTYLVNKELSKLNINIAEGV